MKCRVLRVVFAVAIFLNPIAAFHASSSILRQTLQSSSSHGTSRKAPISPKVLTKYPQPATRQSARRDDQVGADVVSESFGRERSEDVGEVVLAELDDIDADALFATKQAVQALRDAAYKAQSLLDVRTAAAVRIDRRGVVPSLVAVDALSAPLPLLPSSSSPSPPLVPPRLLLVTRNLKAATELAAHLQVGGKELVNGNPVIEPEWIFLTNGARSSSSSSSSSKSPNAWAKKLMGFAARHRLGVCVHSLEAAEALQAEAFAASSRRDTAASSRTSKSGFNKKNKFKKESEIESRKYGGDSGGRGDDESRRGGGRHKDGGLEDASPSLKVTVDVYLSKQFVENSCQLSPDRKTTPDGGGGSNQDDDDDNDDDGEGLGGVWKAMAATHPNLVLRGFVSGGLVAAPVTLSNTESTNLRDGDLLNDDDDDDASDDLFCLRDAAADVWRCGGVCPGGLRLLLPASTLSDEEEEAAGGGGGTAAGRNTNIFGVEKEVFGPLRMNRAVVDCAGGARSAFDEVIFVEGEA